MKKLQGIYAITDEKLTPKSSILDQVTEAIKAGANIIQLRDKTSSDEELENTARKLQEICTTHEALFFVNDRVDLAKKIGADGIHVGFSDLSVSETRKIVGDKMLIGVSCYGDLNRAETAVNQGVDYVAFGAFFPSPTKPKADVVDAKVISQAKKQFDVPVCVIGGINVDNISQLATHNPDMYALVSAVFSGKDITANVHKLQEKLNQ